MVFSLLEGVPTKFPVILKTVWSLDSYVEDVTLSSGKMVEREDVYCNVSLSQPGLTLTSLVVHKIPVCLNYNAKMLFYFQNTGFPDWQQFSFYPWELLHGTYFWDASWNALECNVKTYFNTQESNGKFFKAHKYEILIG